ncbi:multisubunit sodium/proton antiporter, MrpD subunit [Microbulbifer donghaiensis]|uniref:Multisubunit sodium/proton antiporter, MrpD subunit n=1 Tax=Microbulbifer donghaiensis TaxID=494016 RepID=A0A1M4UIW9_9GAMM|nr:Na(+)/H(+) antiporter subunit D [Microbulbifer donghaiensis]SHE56510.1 multisubunit sodium/proton antiporter, MrpD subunit [Microbulbifer donghaiensis]
MFEVAPFIPFFVAALIALFVRGWPRALLMIAVPVLGLANLWLLGPGSFGAYSVLDFDLLLFRADRLSLLFGYLFHIAALIAIIYSLHLRDTMQQVASLLYAGSALGAVFAGDLLTLFIFWELLALTSVFLVWARRTGRAYLAGLRYFTLQILSGLLLLGGIIFYAQTQGSLEFGHIGLGQGAQASMGQWMIFLAFGIKCAFPFFHNWLTDAYPESTPTGTVFLSAFTTKVAVYALARAYPGTELLVYIGATMACFPIFYAVIENDLRRVLAYSLINQLGFMVVGIGIGTSLAINGAVAHAFNDVIFKGLLFMSMGAVLQMTGRINGSELGGLYKTMPKTTVLCIIGAASISAFPLFSGFVSKSMIMSAAIKNGHDWVWLILLFASAGVFHHAGIKIPYFAFFAHDSGLRAKEPPTNMLVAMSIAAALCLAVGIYPQALYRLLPFEMAYSPYDITHVLTQLQLLFFSALAFVWLNLRRLYPPELPSVNLDAEWLYRRLLPTAARGFVTGVFRLDERLRKSALRMIERLLTAMTSHYKPDGVMARSWLTGSMVAGVVLVLGVYLLLGFSR